MMNSCRCGCTAWAVIASVIIGIVGGFLRVMATITVTPAFLWVTLGIAVFFLALAPLNASLLRRSNCPCSVLNGHLIGLLGTALFAVILLGVSFAATSILGAVLTGVLLFFLALALSTVACVARCLSDCE